MKKIPKAPVHSPVDLHRINVVNMFSKIIIIVLCFCASVQATLDSNSVKQDFDAHNKNNVHTKNSVSNDVRRGDQAIGGVHVFEIHSPGGGMGIGIKVLVIAVIAIAVLYWCLKEKCRAFAGRFTNPPVQRTVAELENAIEMCGACRNPEATRGRFKDVLAAV